MCMSMNDFYKTPGHASAYTFVALGRMLLYLIIVCANDVLPRIDQRKLLNRCLAKYS